MRLGTRTRAGISLILGVLVGLGLIILPGVLAPSIQLSTTSSSNVGGPSVLSSPGGTSSNSPTEASGALAPFSLLILTTLVLFPAIALSYIARARTLKRAKAEFREQG